MAMGHPKSEITKNGILSKSCNETRGAKFGVNVSNGSKFSIAHTYKLCHTAFICMKYKM